MHYFKLARLPTDKLTGRDYTLKNFMIFLSSISAKFHFLLLFSSKI